MRGNSRFLNPEFVLSLHRWVPVWFVFDFSTSDKSFSRLLLGCCLQRLKYNRYDNAMDIFDGPSVFKSVPKMHAYCLNLEETVNTVEVDSFTRGKPFPLGVYTRIRVRLTSS